MTKILNLFSGLGGNRKLWDAEITAVESDETIYHFYKKQFPEDEVILGDALDFMEHEDLSKYDFIWASPPCTSHSKIKAMESIIPDVQTLYGTIIYLNHKSKTDWLVENVISWYKPAYEPNLVGRHYIWSNWLHEDIEYISPIVSQYGLKYMNKTLDMPLKELKLPYQRKRQVVRNTFQPKLGKLLLDLWKKTKS